MADRTALGKIGLLLVAATLLVMMTGAVVVADHLSGRTQLDESADGFGASSAADEAR